MTVLRTDGPKGSRWTHLAGTSSLSYGGRDVVYVDRRGPRCWSWTVPQMHRVGEERTRLAAMDASEAVVREAVGAG